MVEELEKLASSVETHGFSEDKNDLYTKIATGASVIEKIAAFSIDSPFAKRLADGVLQASAIGLALAGAGKAVDAATKKFDELKYEYKKNSIIEYAKKRNPNIRAVSNEKLREWLDSAYAISPSVAKNKELATTFLSNAATIDAVDLGTAKTLADINHKGGPSYTTAYDAVRGASSELSKNLISM